MPLLVIPLLILGVLIVLGLAFALVAVLVKMLFVPALILIAVLFWLRRDRQPRKRTRNPYRASQFHNTHPQQHTQRRELNNVQEKDVKKPHHQSNHPDSWDDF